MREAPYPGGMSYDNDTNATGLTLAQQKMREAGVAEAAINVFSDFYHQLEQGVTGSIPEETISPLTEVDRLADVEVDPEVAKDAFSKLVVINLNGGLGTSMGMDRAKSLLPVRDGKSFLEIIVEQVLAARKKTGARLPLLFMNSFRTREDTLEVLAKYPDLQVGDLPLDFLQNKEPKLRRDDLTPVEFPENPELEWCPPGHGDIYTALLTSGVLDALLEQFRIQTTSAPFPRPRLPAGLPLPAPPTRLNCAAAQQRTAREATSPFVSPTVASSCATPPKPRRSKWTTSPMNTATRSSTRTTCGLIS